MWPKNPIKKKAKAKQIPLMLQNWKIYPDFHFFASYSQCQLKSRYTALHWEHLTKRKQMMQVSAILSLSIHSKIVMKTNKSIFHTYWKQLWSQETLARIFTEHKNWWGYHEDFSIMFAKSIWQEILHFTCSQEKKSPMKLCPVSAHFRLKEQLSALAFHACLLVWFEHFDLSRVTNTLSLKN